MYLPSTFVFNMSEIAFWFLDFGNYSKETLCYKYNVSIMEEIAQKWRTDLGTEWTAKAVPSNNPVEINMVTAGLAYLFSRLPFLPLSPLSFPIHLHTCQGY